MTSGIPQNSSGGGAVSGGSASRNVVANRVDALASAFFLSPHIELVTFQSGAQIHIAKTAKLKQDLVKKSQDLADLLHTHLGLEGLITEFGLVSGMFVYYPVDQLDCSKRPPEPRQGATPKTIFIPELLKDLKDKDAANSIRASANALVEELDKLQGNKTQRAAFQIGPDRFGPNTGKIFQDLSGASKTLDQILSISDKIDSDKQVDQVLDFLKRLAPPIQVEDAIERSAKRDYALEYSVQPEGPNVGKILAFLEVDLDELGKSLCKALEKEVSFFSLVSKDKQKQEKNLRIGRFIAECKGYKSDQKSLSDFYEFFRRGTFPFIPPSRIFKSMGGLEEFSSNEEMDRHATLYGPALSTDLANWMKSRSSEGYRTEIFRRAGKDLTRARALVDGVSQEIRNSRVNILKETEENCKRILQELLVKDVNGVKIHELSGMAKAKEVISQKRGDPCHIGDNFLDFAQYYLSCSVLNDKKVGTDLTQGDIYHYLKKFFSPGAAGAKGVSLSEISKVSNNAFFPFKGKKFDLELKKIAFEIFTSIHEIRTDPQIPIELYIKWSDEFQRGGSQESLDQFFQTKASCFDQIKKFSFQELQSSAFSYEEKVFFATKLEEKFVEQFPVTNRKNLDLVVQIYEKRKEKVGQILLVYEAEKKKSLDELPAKTPPEKEKIDNITAILDRVTSVRNENKIGEYAQLSFDLKEDHVEEFLHDCLESLVF